MINDEESGSAQILKGMREQGAPDWALEAVAKALKKQVTRAELFDLIYEQIKVNIALGNALTQLMSDDRKKALAKLEAALEAIKEQTAAFSKLAAFLITPAAPPEAGVDDE